MTTGIEAWKAAKNLRGSGWHVVDEKQTTIADIYERLAEITPEECERRSRLMAAAPELLEALEAAYRTFYDEDCELGKKVAAAIAKAKGESRDDEPTGYIARCGREFETRQRMFDHQRRCLDCMAEQLDEDRERQIIEEHQRGIRR